MPGAPVNPAVEDIFTIAPPPAATIAGIWYFIIRKTPRALTRRAVSKSLIDRLASGVGMWPSPALLNATSSRPKAWRVCWTRCSAAAGSPTSVGMTSAFPPVMIATLLSSRRPPGSARGADVVLIWRHPFLVAVVIGIGYRRAASHRCWHVRHLVTGSLVVSAAVGRGASAR